MKKVAAIILAGGLGTRLSEVVRDRPKVLAQVNGHPFLDTILDALVNSNMIGRVVLAIGYMAEQIIEEYGRNREYPFEIHFSIEEKLLGTGGGIKKALSLTTTEQVLVLNGDSYAEVDLNEFVAFHDKIGAAMTMAVVSVDNANRFGRVFLDKAGRVVSFQEKSADGEGGYINAGVYLFERRLFDSITMDSAISLERELLPQFIKKGIYGFLTKGKFLDIGTPESYRISNDYLSGRISWKNRMF
jgi:D-glycero-alpha-D-manno-heptose 1-phosphate guanylyltransferase